MSKEGEQFWQEEKQRTDKNYLQENKLWKQTYKDSQEIRSNKHPKALYHDCMANNSYMHKYASQSDLMMEDMTAILCKDLGCMVNYCGLLK